MTQRMQEIARTIVDLQAELDREIEHRRRALGVRVHDRLVEFERGIVIEQRKLKTSMRAFLARSSFGAVITAPVIYSIQSEGKKLTRVSAGMPPADAELAPSSGL